MPIQIESLFPESKKHSIARPETNSYIFDSYSLQPDFVLEVSPKTDKLYGGNYASTAAIPPSPIDASCHSVSTPSPIKPAATGDWIDRLPAYPIISWLGESCFVQPWPLGR
jgi:hypothetical protein